MKDKQNLIKVTAIIFSIAILIAVIGITYATYIKVLESRTQVLITGDIYLNFIDGTDIINLTNSIPMSKSEALERNDNIFNFKVTGKNTGNKDVYYGISILDGNIENGKTRINNEDISIYLEENNNVVVNEASLDKFSDDYIYVNKVEKGTTSEIERNYSLRVWLNDNITVGIKSDGAKYSEDEWNNSYVSLKVKVETAEINIMDTFPEVIQNVKENITEVYFMNDTRENIDNAYNAATIKADLTYDNVGNVKCYLQTDPSDNTKYIMYVKSVGKTYLNTGESLFKNFTGMKKINAQNANTIMVTNMYSMFESCLLLVDVKIENFRTENVTTLRNIFADCVNLSDISFLENWYTGNVEIMRGMFALWKKAYENYGSGKLHNIDPLKNWNTSKVTTINQIFKNQDLAFNVNLSMWDTKNFQDMDQAFLNNKNMQSLDLSSWNINKITAINNAFNGCSSLETVYVSNSWQVPLDMESYIIFDECNNLKGQNGTTWSSSQRTALYARIDKPGEPGYFTYKAAPSNS